MDLQPEEDLYDKDLLKEPIIKQIVFDSDAEHNNNT